jgi:hypothetical protein
MNPGYATAHQHYLSVAYTENIFGRDYYEQRAASELRAEKKNYVWQQPICVRGFFETQPNYVRGFFMTELNCVRIFYLKTTSFHRAGCVGRRIIYLYLIRWLYIGIINIFQFVEILKNVRTNVYVKIRSSNVTKKRREVLEKDYINDIMHQFQNKMLTHLEFIEKLAYKNLPVNFLVWIQNSKYIYK